MKYIAIILALIMLASCESSQDHHEKQEVVAVYWHEGNRYTAAVKNGESIAMRRMPAGAKYGVPHSWKFRIITDAENFSWYECKWRDNGFTGTEEGAWCEIHVQSIDDLKTGDWNHGKFGRGKTRRIN